ncbi:hypothetical protein pb186bvf_013471 [Paramecium bursaria]
MIKKYLIIHLQLLVLTSAWLAVSIEQQCQCEHIQYKNDCQIFPGCLWANGNIQSKQTLGQCERLQKRILQTSDFCQNTSSINCPLTKGCAYINQKCILFAGCTSYVYTSVEICRSINIDCTSDGQRCVNNTCPAMCQDCSCQSKQCNEAPITYKTDKQCKSWIPKCYTNGQGCTDQPLPCSSFTDCLNSVGSEGQCWPSETNCRKKQCQDGQYTTNYQCNQFLLGCVTNGKGCVSQLLPCSQQLNCDGTFGTDGWCISENQKCRKVKCQDAILQYYSNSACNQYLSGCITNGVSCVDQLQKCDTYFGNKSQCEQYIGSDGFCTTDVSETKCKARDCTLASYQTYMECQNYSYNCVTNGISCEQQISQCTNTCVDQSSCTNYKTYQQCTLNQQQYKVGDKIYLRECKWVSQSCINQQCPTTLTLVTDQQCKSVLDGCVTNGSGCIDISQPCSAYIGTQQQCFNFSGLNGTQKCTTIAGSNNCVPKTCSNINQALFVINQQNCESWLLGCNFDMKSTCTNGGCATYYGTQSQCQYINTAKDSKGNKQSCWGDNNGSCRVRLCQDAVSSSQNLFNTDAQCNQFLSGCVTNGRGCLPSDSLCSQYQGSMSQCLKFTQSQKGCTLLGRCKKFQCGDIILPVNLLTLDQDKFCQQYYDDTGTTCLAGISTCTKLVILNCSKQVAFGYTGIEKQTYCFKQKCAFKTGSYCQSFECSLFQPVGVTISEQALFCQNLTYNGLKTCGLASNSQYCSIRQCTDLGITSSSQCTNYIINCAYSNFDQKCYLPLSDCQKYQIPTTYDQTTKAQYCTSLQNTYYSKCSYDMQNPQQCATQTTCGNLKVIFGSTQQQIQFCRAQNCGYSINYSLCVNLNYCDKYTLTGSNSSDNIQFCQSTSSISGYQCVFKQGNTGCSEPILTLSDPCTQYTALVNNVNICKSIPQLNCSYLQGAFCKKFQCSDVSDETTCKTYTQCVYNGSQCTDISQVSTCNILGYSCNQSLCTRLPNLTICNTKNIKCSQFNLSYEQLQLTQTEKINVCSQVADYQGNKCLWSTQTPYNCSGQKCDNLFVAQSDLSCNQWSNGCILDQAYLSQCTLILCTDAPQTYTTTAQCSQFRFGCVSNGKSCIESTIPCSQYKGTQQQCHLYIGNGKQCSNYPIATIDQPCIDKYCELNQSASSDSDCEKWLPSTNNIKNCIWNGVNSCVVATTTCSKFIGDINQCSKYLAFDGPCSGSETSSACFQQICNKAPETYNTDQLCKKWHPKCITVGQGCISFADASCPVLKNDSSCSFYKYDLNCDVAKQCPVYSFTSCSQITYSNLCTYLTLSNNSLCIWDYKSQQCTNLTCELLSNQITSDYQCSYQLKGCITTGQGCYKYGPCTSYSQKVCSILKSTDVQQKCIWEGSCRPLKCSDNKTAKTDKECDQFLKGCRNYNFGCVEDFQCTQFLSQDKCTKDSQDRNCLWQNSCILYNSCEDIKGTSNQECQAFSEYCITNGYNCIPYTKCSEYKNQISCQKGTDGTCGFLPNQTCDIFQTCEQALGQNFQDCQRWSNKCISDGNKCVEKVSQCSNYKTSMSCLDGSDRLCVWDSSLCRLPLCKDAPSVFNTFKLCQNYSTQELCTTNGNGCTSLSTCSSYTLSEACHIGTDGQCSWVDSNSTCRIQDCNDFKLVSDIECEQALPKKQCVSDGLTCFKKLNCNQYNIGSMCMKGGLDGTCVFSPIKFTQYGQCNLFTNCEQASQDRYACQSKPDACFFHEYVEHVDNITNTVQICMNHTCSTYSLSNECKSFKSLDQTSTQICINYGNNQCHPGEPTDLKAENCLIDSSFSHTWNVTAELCQPCPKLEKIVIEYTVYLSILSFGVILVTQI